MCRKQTTMDRSLVKQARWSLQTFELIDPSRIASLALNELIALILDFFNGHPRGPESL
jgi:hypothetical protein